MEIQIPKLPNINIKKGWNSFADIFMDSNEINEKSVVGFIAFAIMVIFAVSDIFAGYMGVDLKITEFIYNSFTMITLGSFGIAEVGRIFGRDERYYRRTGRHHTGRGGYGQRGDYRGSDYGGYDEYKKVVFRDRDY